MVLEGLKGGIMGALGKLKGKRKVNPEEIAELVKDIRRALMEADFNIRQTKEITEKLEARLLDGQIPPGLTIQTHAMNIIYIELVRLLGASREIRPHNQTILMVGLYGQGKTTTTAKMAEWWRRRHGAKVAVISGDVHRPGAYSQLRQLLEGVDVDVYGEEGQKDALAVVKNGLNKYGNADVVIVDTAGRHQLDEELVAELDAINKLTSATERLLVIDAQVGQAAGPVAASFHDLVDVTGVVVTKLDGTARGGGALSAVATTGSPIMFTGQGEMISDLELFESNRFISRLLGMGDIEGLIDLAPSDLDQEEANRLAERLMSGRFDLNDMYEQMRMMSKVGTVDRILSHLPDQFLGGLGGLSKGQKLEMQGNLDRYRIIMDSMTAEEKGDPTSIKAERVRRVARGAGVTDKAVRELLNQWGKSRNMMKGIKGNRKLHKQMQSMMSDGSMDDFDMPM